MKLSMTATGDSILIQGYPKEGYEGYEAVKNYIAKGDAKFGNLESCVSEWDTYASAYCGGTWLSTRPEVFRQILDFGFDFLGNANNHTMDMGPDGLMSTIRYAAETDVALAGVGRDLGEASAPVYRTFRGGRVAFIAVTSSYDTAAMAGYRTQTMPGRPGLNALTYDQTIHLSPEHYEQMQKIIAATKINGRADKSRANGFSIPLPEGTSVFGKYSLKLSADGTDRIETKCTKRDLARFRDAITDAKLVADYVAIMFHSHQIRGDEMSEPAEFAEEFSRFCIDCGADVILGNGTHEFKPIEIYKGKPIFYSMGNFCFQSNVVEHQAKDLLDKFNFEEMTDVQALAKRNKGWTIGLHTQIANFLTYIPYMEFEDGTLTHLELMPVELGFNLPRTFKGLPHPADKETTKEIFNILSKLSAPYGTKMKLDRKGIIQVSL